MLDMAAVEEFHCAAERSSLAAQIRDGDNYLRIIADQELICDHDRLMTRGLMTDLG